MKEHLQKIEIDKTTYCYSSEIIEENPFCISLLYLEWIQKIQYQKMCISE